MAFSTYETSGENRTPVELYEISTGPNEYFFTSAGESYLSNGNDYEPLPGVSRGDFTISGERKQNYLSVTMPASHPFVRSFINISPGRLSTMKIFQMHRLDGGTPERVAQFVGLVQNVAFKNLGEEAELTLMPPFSLANRTIPRETFQHLCNNMLYGNLCKASEASFTYSGNISDVDGDVITVDGLAATKGADWSIAGFITNADRTDYRLITGQSGDDVTVMRPFHDEISVLNQTLFVIAGCDHSLPTCISKFGNGINYRGFWFSPTRDIHDQGF